jgi:hypothetical protein
LLDVQGFSASSGEARRNKMRREVKEEEKERRQ